MMIAEITETVQEEALLALAGELEAFVRRSAEDGQSLHEVEQGVLGRVLHLGHQALQLFLQLQGAGNLGPTVTTADGQRLQRSAEPVRRTIRTVFGVHHFSAFVYASGPKQKIELRPVDARMSLPEHEASYLLEEFSQYFCIEEAFGKARQHIERVLQQWIPVDTLERINRRVAVQAEAFFSDLPVPPPEDEGALLVLTGDGKGVPLVRSSSEPLPAFGESERRGQRRMATLASVYSVDRHVRTPEAIVAALFRAPTRPRHERRPRPVAKRVLARFARSYPDGDQDWVVPGPFEAFSWAAEEVRRRHQPGQPLLRLFDGQESLWEISACCLEPDQTDTIDILDIIHVAQYVWKAAQALCGSNREQAEAFVRERLLRILQGQVRSVTAGLRRMARRRTLRGQARRPAGTWRRRVGTSPRMLRGCGTTSTCRRGIRSPRERLRAPAAIW